MSYLSALIAWLTTGTNGFMLSVSASALVFMIMIAGFLFKAIRKVDLTYMLYEPGTTIVSSTKFWHVVACFVATLAFLFINFAAPGAGSLEFIWLTYLGVIAGSASVSKLIAAKFPGITPDISDATITKESVGKKLDP